MALLNEGEKVTTVPKKPRRFKYHVAFSYSSGDAEYVGQVSTALPKGVKHFDYRTEETKIENWGHDLKKQLEYVYGNVALFCVVFISKAYVANKKWTENEWKVASLVAKRKPGYILPVHLDDTKVPELEHLVWMDRLPPEQLARLIDGAIRRPPPKPWWFYLSTEVKVAIAVAVVALILTVIFSLPSRTSLASVHANEEGITAHLVNIRTKSATIVGQRLKFGALPLEDVELRLAPGESATIAPGLHDLKLVAMQLLTKCDDEGIRPRKQKIEPRLAQQPVTLEIDIRESDDAPGHSTTRIQTFPAARLKPLVGKVVSGRDTLCDD